MIRTIRLLGAALGGIVGLALGTAGEGLFGGSYGGALMAAWVIAWVVVGFSILPYLTIVPGRLAHPARPGALDRRVRDRRRRACCSVC